MHGKPQAGFDRLANTAALIILKAQPLEPGRLYFRVLHERDTGNIEQRFSVDKRNDFVAV
jgi:hypothetical protein